MKTRSHIHEETFDIAPERMFELLITPSAIRGWWGASRAIVMPQKDGIWTAAWGDEDDPDYISTATLVEFDPPRTLAMKYGKYYAKTGSLPFEFADDALTTFTIEPNGADCMLRVEQTGFPCDPIADEFYAACETGWTNTFQRIRFFTQYPSVDDENEEYFPDEHLSAEQEFRVSQLTEKEITQIDATLLANASTRERKVAGLVGSAIMDLNDQISRVPDLFYARRVRKLVGEGKLIAEGNLDFMRFSEVRLSEGSHAELVTKGE